MTRSTPSPRFGPALLLASLGALLAVGGFLAPLPARAAGNTLSVAPATSTGVAVGGTVTLKIVQNAEVATSGAQVTITFDQAKLQITTLAKGSPYTGGLWAGDSEAAISSANGSGKLATLAVTLTPPSSVPAGAADFLSITFKAVACGKSDIGLPVGPLDAVLLDGRADTYGEGLTVTTTGGSIDVACTGASPTPTAGASPTPQPDGSTPQPDGSTPPPSGGSTPPPSGGSTPPPAAPPDNPPSNGTVNVTGSPPDTDAVTQRTVPVADPWALLLLGLTAVAASVVAVDLARRLVRPWR